MPPAGQGLQPLAVRTVVSALCNLLEERPFDNKSNCKSCGVYVDLERTRSRWPRRHGSRRSPEICGAITVNTGDLPRHPRTTRHAVVAPCVRCAGYVNGNMHSRTQQTCSTQIRGVVFACRVLQAICLSWRCTGNGTLPTRVSCDTCVRTLD